MKIESGEIPYLALSTNFNMKFINAYSLSTLRKHKKDFGVNIVCVYQITETDKGLTFEKVTSIDDLLASEEAKPAKSKAHMKY